ncbi:MAG: hypothetical protein PVH83_09995 [Methyloceanibacter sp.]|jgi:hypothetical protein
MLLMMKFSIPVESGNLAARSGRMEKAIESVVNATNAEAAYFTMIDGERGGYIFFEEADQAQLTHVTEALMSALEAAVEIVPALSLEDLKHGLPN